MSPSRIRQIAPRASAAEEVRSQLLALIEAGEYPVGERIPSENELARSFGVSRPIVREGLGALRAAGVLETRSGSGTYVRSIRPTKKGLLLLGHYSSSDLHEVRAHLEIPGAGLAARRRTEQQLEAMTRIVEHHAGISDVVEWVEDDLAFHVALAEATGNELQAKWIADLRQLQFEQSVQMAGIGGGVAAPDEEHRAILDAVRRQDEQGAREAMAEHLRLIGERLDSAQESRANARTPVGEGVDS